MRLSILILLFTIPVLSLSQDKDLEYNKSNWKNAVKDATDNERLKFLDSLAGAIRYDSTFNSDSIFRVTISFAQKMDSINMAMKHAINFINYLNYETNDYKEAKNLIKSTYPLLAKVSKPNILDDFYYEAAYVYYESRHFEEAIKLFDSAYVYAKKYNSKYIELSKFSIAMAHVNNGKFGEASIELQKAALLFQNKKDTLMWLNAKNSMSILYSKNGFFKEAKEERNELIKLAKISNSFPNLALVYYNNAADDNKINLQDSRIKNLKLALVENQTSENKAHFEPALKAGLTAALAENDSLYQAQNLLKELEMEVDNMTGQNAHYYLNAKMRVAFAQNDYENALKYALKLYDLKIGGDQYEEIQEAELFLSQVYQRIGNNDQAFSHFKNYTKIKDSIGSIQKTRVLAYYQTIYETEKRDLTIQNQNSNIALLDSENKQKNQWLLFGGLGLLGLFGFMTIVRSNNNNKRRQKQQELFTQDIINTQEQERTRLAFELHDSVGQQLMLLTRKLKTIEDPLFGTLASDTLDNLRTISQGLYPAALERLGFTAAISDLVNEMDEKTDVFFTLELENTDQLISKDKALHLYRMLQEALNNVLKHADAKAVFVRIENTSNTIVMTIKDNGKGFDYNHAVNTSKSLGMKSLMERCKIISAQLEIESSLGKGTQLIIKLPVRNI
ncbi:tetratricopeptide repeat-containing sensor histidine kinase [Gelidibacter mesophilus]|uniref:tetratricopeptide repeat-containing sensor histidine kinase n=1 Tax=Gelidibacter mesophilus TaxID=169050 RepID=UPI00040536FF|nr:sensor histidine kinase [Gelidibacter mesophilus]